MDYVGYFGLLSAVVAASSLYLLYTITYYILWRRHPAAFKNYGFSPPTNPRDWVVSKTIAILGSLILNVMYIGYMIQLEIGPELVSWIVMLCITQCGFLYILQKEKPR